jgi:hypothetical protein
MPYDDLYEKHGRRVGIDPSWLKRIAQIENSERATGCTGSYCGLFQMSKSEFTRNGGTGSIFDPEQNTMAAANKMAREALAFKEKYGRDPTLTDIYMVHQQGEAGYDAHMRNPDQPAVASMHSTGEGKEKGLGWSRLAISLNTPGGTGQYGGTDKITSQQFVEAWDAKLKGGGALLGGHEQAGLPVQAEDLPEEGAIITSEDAGLPEGAPGAKRTRAGRGAADAQKASLINETEEEDFKPNIPKFQVPDLSVKFTEGMT